MPEPTNPESEQLLDIRAINREFRKIAAAKGWQAYHTPKNLAAAISVEAGELLAEFQWLTAAESETLQPKAGAAVAAELADIIMYVCELSERLNINLPDAIQAKINTNRERFLSD